MFLHCLAATEGLVCNLHQHQPEPSIRPDASIVFTPVCDPSVHMSQQTSWLIPPGDCFQPSLPVLVKTMQIVASASCSQLTGEAPGLALCWFGSPALRFWHVVHAKLSLMVVLCIPRLYLSPSGFSVTQKPAKPLFSSLWQFLGHSDQPIFRFPTLALISSMQLNAA